MPRFNRPELKGVTGIAIPALSKLIGYIFIFISKTSLTLRLHPIDGAAVKLLTVAFTCCSGREGMEFGAVAEGVRTQLVKFCFDVP